MIFYKKSKTLLLFIYLIQLLHSKNLLAQRGKTSNLTISNTQIVNEYTAVTADITAGTTTIQVANSSLNANNRFNGNLSAGDLIMIIQMQGATLNLTPDPNNSNLSLPKDSTWGTIINYNNAGNYEFAQVASVPNNTTIIVDCGIQKNYTASGKVQVIRVPRYQSLTVTSSGTITCEPWNGTTGGVVAIEVLGVTTLSGKIDVTGKGFRGGGQHEAKCLDHELEVWGMSAYKDVGMQGEGIAGDTATYVTIGAKYGRGAPANGGGGGSNKSAGGGGGANAGDPALYTGNGNPDISNSNYITAWNLEYNGFAYSTSSGGGRGGYGASTQNANPLTTPPKNNAWGTTPFRRLNSGGRGGRPLDYSTGKIFMGGGGGGGCGDQTYNTPEARTPGANGGGLIYLLTYNDINGNGQLLANGNSVTLTTRDDGAGGGGAGGTILINSTGVISSSIIAKAEGGKGGNQVVPKTFGIPAVEAEGPGGGGGGGYISISGGTIIASVQGGANGTTDARPMPNFLPNGATKGGNGIYNNTLPNFATITSSNVTVCSGGTATLTATMSGNIPSGAVITWYDAAFGGTVLGTGNNFTLSNVTSQQIIYVGICPGTYRIADTIKVVTSVPINAGNDVAVCSGETIQLQANGGISYSWTPATGLSSNTIANPIAFPSTLTTYTVFGTDANGCIGVDTITVSVNPKPTVTINSSATAICQGQPVTLQANGGISYSWHTNLNANFSNASLVTVNPNSSTIYTLIGTSANGCKDTATQNIIVNSLPNISITNTKPAFICPNDSISLNASGGISYSWQPASGLSSTTSNNVTAHPTTNTLYTVIGSDGNCINTDTISVFIKNITPAVVSPDTAKICLGQTATFIASGGNNYTWLSPSNIVIGNSSSLSISPNSDSTYQLNYFSNGCKLTAFAPVLVGTTVDVKAFSSKDTICRGESVTLTAQNGGNFTWTSHSSLSGTIGNTVTATPVSTTTYTVTGGTGTCTDTGLVTVWVNATPTITGNTNYAICVGSNVTLSVGGATNYTWSPGLNLTLINDSTVSVNPTSSTQYTVNSGIGNCKDTLLINVQVDATPANVTVTPSATTVCNGSSLSVSASGAITFSWLPAANFNPSSGNTVTLLPTAATTYTVVGTNTICTDTSYFTINVLTTPTVTVNPTNSNICAGSSVTITATGNAPNYSWIPATGLSNTNSQTVSASPLSTTQYTVVGYNGTCSDSAFTTVNVFNPITISLNFTDSTICAMNTVTLTAGGAPNYSWFPASGLNTTNGSTVNASPTTTTNYTVVGYNNACSDTGIIKITVTPPINLSVTATENIICSGKQTTLTATANATTFSWYPSNGLTGNNTATVLASPLTSQTYTVTAISGNCSETATINIQVLTSLTVMANASPTSVCKGESAVINASGATNYTWINANSTNATVSVSPTTTTTYTVIGNIGTCYDSAFVTINVYNLPVITAEKDQSIALGTETTISATGGISYQWTPSTGIVSCSSCSTAIIKPESTTTYTVTGTDANGCKNSATVTITVDENYVIYIPSAFSPNNDGENDVFYVRGRGIKELKLLIFNSWGEKIFESLSPSIGWDGTRKGIPLNSGVFIYQVSGTFYNGQSFNQKGDISLIR
jgi:gliding motility-associated-like protein